MKTTRTGIVALIIKKNETSELSLVDKISDDREVSVLESAIKEGAENPLQIVYENRRRNAIEDEEFGDYIEELLSQPFLKKEIREHGLQWLKSKMRIEEYQKTEVEAAQIIADYAFKIFMQNQSETDFILAAPHAKVRVRIFVFNEDSQQQAA